MTKQTKPTGTKIDVMIVGAEKAGTTALLSLLGSHPKINASEQVECPFFTRVDEYEKGNSWLLDQYFSKKEAGNFLVGKHVGLFNNSIGLKRLVKTNKDIIIVTMVRDPIKRAYSAFWYNKMKGRELEDTFEKAVELSEPNFGYLCNAHYMRHIKTVNSLVEQENHIIITSEDFFQEPVKQAGLILEKLGEFKEQVNVELMWRNEGGKARSIFVNKLFFNSIEWIPGPLVKFIKTIVGVSRFRKIKYAVLKINHKKFIPPPIKDRTQTKLAGYFEHENKGLALYINTTKEWVLECGEDHDNNH